MTMTDDDMMMTMIARRRRHDDGACAYMYDMCVRACARARVR